MRSIWKGAISFGLVSIGVKLYSATEERDVAFHQVHRSDGGRIRYKRICQADGEEVSYGDIAKGFELPGGEMVVLTDDDLADLPLTTSRAIDVLTFVPLEQVDPIYFAKSYYLEPDKGAGKPYVLLRDALAQSDRVAVVKIALRQRESLATLRVRDDVLVLETMIWPDEVRAAEFGFLSEEVAVRPQELAMAQSLIDSMAGDFDPSQYSDEYREALEQVIAAKVEGREIVEPVDQEVKAPTGVVDLMAALRASVERAKQTRGDGADRPAVRAAPPVKEATAGSPASKGRAGRTVEKAPAKKAIKSNGQKAAQKAAQKAVQKPAKKAATRRTA
ncbi:MAG: Ku protein [Actinomycetota bacterium]|nr:Ku protein [Actinomycetota bacterium]